MEHRHVLLSRLSVCLRAAFLCETILIRCVGGAFGLAAVGRLFAKVLSWCIIAIPYGQLLFGAFKGHLLIIQDCAQDV